MGLISAAKINWDGSIPIPPDPIPPGSNAYFEYLLEHTAFWKGLSLRPVNGAPITSPYYEKQLLRPNQGGYLNSNSAPIVIAYDNAVDAAKVTVKCFGTVGTLGVSMTPTDTRIYPTEVESTFTVGRQIRVDSEVMIITQRDPSTTVPWGCTVNRAQYGTSAASHNAGTSLEASTNSLANQLRFPLGATKGNNYWFTWDVLHTTSWLYTGMSSNKTFQFDSYPESIWLEHRIQPGGGTAATKPPGFNSANGDLAGINVRSYNTIGGPPVWSDSNGNQLGPGVTNNDPVLPINNTFQMYPTRWTRFWSNINLRSNDYDVFNLYMADEVQEPKLIYSNILISIRPPNYTINQWWIEYNTSTSPLPVVPGGRTTDFRDLISYVRNFAALQNPASPPPLVKPE